jgi:hypothetical protein
VTIAPGGYARPCTTTSAPDPKEEIIAASATASPSSGGRVYCSADNGRDPWFPLGKFAGGASCPRNWGGCFSFTAVAKDGYIFTDWEDGDGHLLSYATTFSPFEEAVPRGLTAHFRKVEQCALDLTVTGCGWLDSSKKRKYFATGETVKLTAHPASCGCGSGKPEEHCCCSSLKQWVGTAYGIPPASVLDPPNEIVIVITGNTSVGAVFTPAVKVTAYGAHQDLAGGECWNTQGQDQALGEPWKDSCKNKVQMWCCGPNSYVSSGHFEVKYNDAVVAYCLWNYAVNTARIWCTGTSEDAFRFKKIRYLSRQAGASDINCNLYPYKLVNGKVFPTDFPPGAPPPTDVLPKFVDGYLDQPGLPTDHWYCAYYFEYDCINCTFIKQGELEKKRSRFSTDDVDSFGQP